MFPFSNHQIYSPSSLPFSNPPCLIYGKSTEELLYNHLLTCPLCHVKAEQYCLYGAELGKQYDALLLNSEHAQERRTALVMQVDRANITGNKRYIPFQPAPF